MNKYNVPFLTHPPLLAIIPKTSLTPCATFICSFVTPTPLGESTIPHTQIAMPPATECHCVRLLAVQLPGKGHGHQNLRVSLLPGRK